MSSNSDPRASRDLFRDSRYVWSPEHGDIWLGSGGYLKFVLPDGSEPLKVLNVGGRLRVEEIDHEQLHWFATGG